MPMQRWMASAAGGDEPAVEAGLRDDVLARKKAGLLAGGIEIEGRAQVRSPKSSGFHPLLSLFTLLCSAVADQFTFTVAR